MKDFYTDAEMAELEKTGVATSPASTDLPDFIPDAEASKYFPDLATSTQESVPEEKGLFGKIRSNLDRRLENTAQSKAMVKSGDQSLASGLLQATGQAAGFLGDTLFGTAGATLSKVTPDIIENPVKKFFGKGVKYVGDQQITQDIVGGYQAAKEKFPTATRNLEAAANISSILPTEALVKGALKTAAPMVAKPAKAISTKTQVTRKLLSDVADPAINKQIETDLVENLFTINKANKNRYNQASQQLAKSNTTIESELVKRGIIPDIEDGKAYFSNGRVALREEYDALNNALDTQIQRYKPLMIDEPETLSAINRAVDEDSMLRNAGNRELVRKEAQKILEGYKNDYGRASFNVPEINDFKKAQYKLSSKYGKAFLADPTKADAHSVVARAFKDLIEEKVEDVSVRALNEQIGLLNTLDKFLSPGRGIEGTAIRGGRLGRYGGRVLGALVGANQGPIGAILGSMGGDTLARVLQKNAVIGPLRKAYLRRTTKGFENPVLKQTLQYLDDIDRGLVPKMPEAVRRQIIKDLEAQPKLLMAPKPGSPNIQIDQPINIPSRLQSRVDEAEGMRRFFGGIKTRQEPQLFLPSGEGKPPLLPKRRGR